MKIIFHVGPDKTGTKSIQQALQRNYLNLLENGVYFPLQYCDEDGAHHPLFRSLECSSSDVPSLEIPPCLSGEDGRATFDAIRLDAENLGCHTVLLSSEMLWWWDSSSLFCLFNTYCDSFEQKAVVLFVRDYFSRERSIVLQSLRNGGIISKKNQFPFDGYLRGYSQLHELSDLIEINALNGTASSADFLSLFFEFLKIRNSAEVSIVNPSMTLMQARYINYFNSEFPRLRDSATSSDLIYRAHWAIFNMPLSPEPWSPGDKFRRELMLFAGSELEISKVRYSELHTYLAQAVAREMFEFAFFQEEDKIFDELDESERSSLIEAIFRCAMLPRKEIYGDIFPNHFVEI